MDRRRCLAGLAAFAACAAVRASRAQPDVSPVGLWRTFDDHTGRERGKVRIWEDRGILYGQIVAVLDPEEAKKVCVPCTDSRKDQPIIGLPIIRGLRPDGNGWSGGEILDPETGSVYRCRMHLEDSGRKLVVRGYLGISLIGRSQTWLRAA